MSSSFRAFLELRMGNPSFLSAMTSSTTFLFSSRVRVFESGGGVRKLIISPLILLLSFTIWAVSLMRCLFSGITTMLANTLGCSTLSRLAMSLSKVPGQRMASCTSRGPSRDTETTSLSR